MREERKGTEKTRREEGERLQRKKEGKMTEEEEVEKEKLEGRGA